MSEYATTLRNCMFRQIPADFNKTLKKNPKLHNINQFRPSIHFCRLNV